MVSLREGELALVALRGAIAVDGRPVSRVTLREGVVVHLARGVTFEVVSVRLPDVMLGVEGAGVARQALPGVCSVVLDGDGLRLATGWRDDAVAQVWSTGETWRWRQGDGEAGELADGDTLTVAGHALRFVALPLRAAGLDATRRAGEIDAPLTVIAQFDNVHVQRAGDVPLVLPGKQGQLVSELVACGGPVAWSVLASLLWPDLEDEAMKRSRVDVLLSKLRRRLRGAGVRDDLVRTDGAGRVEVFLHAHDVLVDRT